VLWDAPLLALSKIHLFVLGWQFWGEGLGEEVACQWFLIRRSGVGPTIGEQKKNGFGWVVCGFGGGGFFGVGFFGG